MGDSWVRSSPCCSRRGHPPEKGYERHRGGARYQTRIGGVSGAENPATPRVGCGIRCDDVVTLVTVLMTNGKGTINDEEGNPRGHGLRCQHQPG